MKKSSSTKTPAKKFVDPNDSIADDVRKIKESMQKGVKPATSAKKSREPAKSTPTGRSSRSSKKEEKVTVKAEPEETVKVEEKPKENNELKDLLADWIDDEDVDEKVEGNLSNNCLQSLRNQILSYQNFQSHHHRSQIHRQRKSANRQNQFEIFRKSNASVKST